MEQDDTGGSLHVRIIASLLPKDVVISSAPLKQVKVVMHIAQPPKDRNPVRIIAVRDGSSWLHTRESRDLAERVD